MSKFLDDNPAITTLGLSALLGGGTYALARAARKRGVDAKPIRYGLTASALPLLYAYLTKHVQGSTGYNVDRYGLAKGLTRSTPNLLANHDSTDRYVRKWLESLPVAAGWVPKLPEGTDVSKLYRSDLPLVNVLGTKPLSGTDDNLRWQAAVHAIATAAKPLKKGAGYRPIIHLSTAQDAILNDRFLTPVEKQRTLSVLNGNGQPSSGIKGILTTGDVVRGAVGAGFGSLAAKYIGTVVGGTVGGLKPSTLQKVQDIGAFAGMLRGTGVWQ